MKGGTGSLPGVLLLNRWTMSRSWRGARVAVFRGSGITVLGYRTGLIHWQQTGPLLRLYEHLAQPVIVLSTLQIGIPRAVEWFLVIALLFLIPFQVWQLTIGTSVLRYRIKFNILEDPINSWKSLVHLYFSRNMHFSSPSFFCLSTLSVVCFAH